jgi:hypothetical protein
VIIWKQKARKVKKAGGDAAVHFDLEHIGLDDVGDFLALPAFQWEEVAPPGVLVAHEAPVDAGEEVEDVDPCGGKVNEAHPAEPILLVGLLGEGDLDRAADHISGDAEQGERDGVDPVVGAHRQFPHVNAPVLNRSAAIQPKNILYTHTVCAHSFTRTKSG